MKRDREIEKALNKSIEQLMLNSPTCLLWPDCGCAQTITHWQRLLDDTSEIFTPEEVEAAECVIYFAVACAAKHCPDRPTKAYCDRQFANLLARRQRIELARLRERRRA
jgi:hypothetical protein